MRSTLNRTLRQSAVCLLAAGGLMMATAGVSLAQTKLSVAKVANDFALMMADYGKSKGIFQKHGLDIDVALITQAKMVQAMIAGSVDIALASGSTISVAAKDAPLKAVAAIDGPPNLLVLVIPANSNATVKSLKGKTVAVTNLGSLTDWAVSRIATKEGWDVKDIKRVGVGDTPSRVAAIKTGAADAAVIDIAAAYELEARGEGKILVNFGEIVPVFQNQAIFASDAIIKKNPNAVRGFIQGFLDTLQYARDHRDETIAFAAKELNVSPQVGAKVYDKLIQPGFFTRDGQITPEVLTVLSDSFVELGVLKTKVDLSSSVDLSMLPKNKK